MPDQTARQLNETNGKRVSYQARRPNRSDKTNRATGGELETGVNETIVTGAAPKRASEVCRYTQTRLRYLGVGVMSV